MFVLGTAGHVDHGKSTLIKALTGIDPDRLAEEKERSMTIDLGFAWLKLPSGWEVGIVDVPGHEHFIKNMLAGVSGMDLALLVVDANEGIMPQTREHLAILDLMEIQKVVAVITKMDMVDKEILTLVVMELEEALKPTRFAGAPIVAVSATTGEGLKELQATIDRVLGTAQARKDISRPRLPIDRAFTISGSGTVVTGTLIDGSLTVGHEVEIAPQGLKTRLRSLQTHKAQIDTALPGSRVAANLVGISASQIRRGDVLTTPGWLEPTTLLDARLRLLSHALRHGTNVSFHAGSDEVAARVRVLDREALPPGETSFVQFILNEPIAVVNGDHFIIRSPMDTLGGGTIIESHTKRHRRFRPEVMQSLKIRGEGTAGEVILAKLAGQQPQELAALLAQSNLPPDDAGKLVESLIQQKSLVRLGEGWNGLLFTASGWENLTGNIVVAVRDYHRKFPLRPGMPRAELNSRLKLGVHASAVLQKLISDGVLAEEAALVRLSSHEIKLAPAQQTQVDAYLRQLDQNPYAPAPDIALEPDLLNLLVQRGQVVKTGAGVIFAAVAYSDMVDRITAHIKKNGRINVAAVRDMFQTSRKYALALMEYLDEKKITRRVGDDRVLVEKGKPG
jgi:selenocysteine-specific elongation factor